MLLPWKKTPCYGEIILLWLLVIQFTRIFEKDLIDNKEHIKRTKFIETNWVSHFRDKNNKRGSIKPGEGCTLKEIHSCFHKIIFDNFTARNEKIRVEPIRPWATISGNGSKIILQLYLSGPLNNIFIFFLNNFRWDQMTNTRMLSIVMKIKKVLKIFDCPIIDLFDESRIVPFFSHIFSINDKFCLWLTTVWKNLKFWSPSYSQLFLLID